MKNIDAFIGSCKCGLCQLCCDLRAETLDREALEAGVDWLVESSANKEAILFYLLGEVERFVTTKNAPAYLKKAAEVSLAEIRRTEPKQ